MTMSRQIVKEKRNIWKYVPLAGKNRFATTTGYVTYLPPRLWKQWNTTPRTQNVLDLVRHESVHVEQWEAEGAEYVRKYYKYRAWRLRYEVSLQPDGTADKQVRRLAFLVALRVSGQQSLDHAAD
jgi:hypothetical protein